MERHESKKTASEMAFYNQFLNFQGWVSRSFDWYWIVDENGRYVWSSKQVEKLLGYPVDEIQGKAVIDMIPQRDKARFMGFLESVTDGYQSYNSFEHIMKTKDGQEKYLVASGIPLFNDQGEYKGYRGISHDITTLKQNQWELEKSKKIWQRTQKMAKVASWELNVITGKPFFSDELFSLFDIERRPDEELGLEFFLSMVHPEDREKLKSVNEEAKNHQLNTDIEFRLVLPDHSIKYLYELIQSIEDDFGNVVIVTGTIQDITTIKKNQLSLNRKIAFEHQIAEIAGRFVNVDNTEEALNEAIKEIGLFTDARRSCIFKIDLDNSTMAKAFEWCRQGIAPLQDYFQNLPLDIASHWIERFKANKPVIIDDVKALSENRQEEKELLLKQGIRKVIARPVFVKKQLWGFFGIEYKEGRGEFDSETATLISVFNQILQNYIEKQQADQRLKELNRKLEKLVEERTRALQSSLEEVKKAQAHLDLALKLSDVGLFVWDFQKDIVPEYFTYSQYFKYIKQPGDKRPVKTELIDWENSIHPDHWDFVINEKLKALEGLINEYSIDYKIWLDSARDWRWIIESGKMISRDVNGNPLLMVGSYVDITERKENELLLENAKRAAEKANKNKSEFLANLNHELRTPLTIILGNTETLLHSDMERELKGFLKRINHSAKQLLELINDIVDISKIDEGNIKPERKEVSSDAFFGELNLLMTELAQKNGIDYRFNTTDAFPETFHTDPKLLNKILSNLIKNSIKFTDDGDVLLTADKSDEKNEYVFTVEDTGIGIPSNKQKEIFDRFVQVDSSSKRKYQGTGLGLAIVKSAVESLDGSIDLESQPGEGSRFTIHIPIQ